jgi:alkanesulfonate monooxygenase SsuD/methylene tetrahydromethanopterin reductase-like flavin-dependent oxidoreductase (luciferase family)
MGGAGASARPTRGIKLGHRGRAAFRHTTGNQGIASLGTPDQMVEQIEDLERAVLTRLLLLPRVPVQRKVIREFAERVMPLLEVREPV